MTWVSGSGPIPVSQLRSRSNARREAAKNSEGQPWLGVTVVTVRGPGCLHLGKAGQRAVGICYIRRAAEARHRGTASADAFSRSTLQGSRTTRRVVRAGDRAPHAARGTARSTVAVEGAELSGAGPGGL